MKAIAIIFYIKIKKYFTTRVCKQLWLLLLFFNCFYVSASYFVIMKGLPLSIWQWLVGIVLLIVLLICGILLYKLNIKKIISFKCYRFRDHMPIIALLSVCFIMRVPMLNTLPRWDAGEYYYSLGTACQNFNFTFNSFWNFRIAGHPTLGFAFFMAIGEFLNPRGVVGVLVINLLGTLFAIYCIYGLFLKWIPNCSRWRAVVLAFVVSITPLFYGTFSYVNVDYSMAIFFTIMVYMAVTRRYILLTFFAVCTSQTKEPGILLVVGYFLFHLIKQLYYADSKKEHLRFMLLDGINWSFVSAGAIYILYLVRQGALFAWGSAEGTLVKTASELTVDGRHNSFAFIPEYIMYKLKQFFLLNFAWVSTILIIVSILTLLCYFFKHSKTKSIVHLSCCFEIFGALFAFILFSCFYVTSTLSRYNIVIAVFLTFLSLLLFENILEKNLANKVYIIGGSLLSILLIFQTFFAIDNVSNYFFSTVKTGENNMLFTDYNATYYGDGLVNSYQYTWINRAFNKMLKDVEYDEETLIIDYRSMGAGSQIAGNGNVYIVNWNTQSKQRSYIETSQKPSIIIPIKNISYDRMLFENRPISDVYTELYQDELPKKAVLYFIPYYGESEESALLELTDTYTVVSRETASVIGGTITYYILEKINSL